MSKILQGLNIESQFTTIKFVLEGDNISDITKLLDHVASFHPIFIKEYSITPEELVIRSKLPRIWSETEEYIKKLSKREIEYDTVYDFVVNKVISKRIKSMSTISLLQAAHDKNIESTLAVLSDNVVAGYKEGYIDTFNRYYVVGCGKGSQIIGSIASTKDSSISQKIQRDKWSTNLLIERLALPIVKWQILTSEKDIEKVWDSYSKPLVIKPTGLVGGKGVSVNLNTLEEAKKAYKNAKNQNSEKIREPWQNKVMIQEQVAGEDYRLLVIDGKLEVVTKRIPAFVTGNGKSTIKELIEETNSDPRRDISNPAHILKPIVIDRPLLHLLKSKNLSLESIPQKDEVVNVRNIASMSQGGITEDFTESVSKEIRLMVESIAQSIHAFTLGVDILCKDISKPLTKENGAILEVNTMPEAYLNLYPVIGTQRGYVAENYIDALLSENNCKKYIFIGQSKDDISTLLRRKRVIKDSETVGEAVGDKYYISGVLINEGLQREHLTEAIKCNASLDVIILHFRDWKEVEEYGLGFDHINTVYITKEEAKEKEYMKILKKYKRMKLIDKIKKI